MTMLFYDRVPNSKVIDINRNGKPISKECSFCHFYTFKDRSFNYQSYSWNGYKHL